ncbi:MAG: hypothetical protein ACKVY0_29425 [Prosthecobacter sp.]|uniref:hypothetical protein n=1 Tax=Prosthecobacter sp. TaxID=1965333 RepID=UPI0039038AC1
MNTLRQPLFREATTALLVALLLLQSATAVAPGPAWWGSQSVVDPYALPDDFAVANAGQLKYLAAKAAAAMDAELPGGAGTAIDNLIEPWGDTLATAAKPDNGLAINHGQLKQVAAPFYERLGLPYPWAGSSGVRDDYQLVNLGQLKHVFAFELKYRGPGSLAQIPDAMLAAAQAQWSALPEAGRPEGSTPDDLDGDGISNLQEYLMHPTLPLFDPDDLDGDRIRDSIEGQPQYQGILSKLNFADAVWDQEAGGAAAYYDLDWNVYYQGDGVMNYEEVRLGLDLAASTTSTRTDGLTDTEVLVWTLNAGAPLTPDTDTDAVRLFWETINTGWLAANSLDTHLEWLDDGDANNDNVPDGLATFRTYVCDPLQYLGWLNPDAWTIENPPLAYDGDGNLIDVDGDGTSDVDRDGDGLPDLWEYRYELNLRDAEDAGTDPDGDELVNSEEYAAGTNPRLADSDGDGFEDGVELTQGGDPLDGAVGLPLVLALLSSGNHYVSSGGASAPLAVRVTQGGQPVLGVQVEFTLITGGGLLRSGAAAASTGVQVTMTTGSGGIASASYLAAVVPGSAGVAATLAGGSQSVSFNLHILAGSMVAGSGSPARPWGGAAAPPPPAPDADGDGIPDAWEIKHGLDPLSSNASWDHDQDGFTDVEEYRLGSDLFDFDSRPLPSIEVREKNYISHYDKWTQDSNNAVLTTYYGAAGLYGGETYLYVSGFDGSFPIIDSADRSQEMRTAFENGGYDELNPDSGWPYVFVAESSYATSTAYTIGNLDGPSGHKGAGGTAMELRLMPPTITNAPAEDWSRSYLVVEYSGSKEEYAGYWSLPLNKVLGSVNFSRTANGTKSVTFSGTAAGQVKITGNDRVEIIPREEMGQSIRIGLVAIEFAVPEVPVVYADQPPPVPATEPLAEGGGATVGGTVDLYNATNAVFTEGSFNPVSELKIAKLSNTNPSSVIMRHANQVTALGAEPWVGTLDIKSEPDQFVVRLPQCPTVPGKFTVLLETKDLDPVDPFYIRNDEATEIPLHSYNDGAKYGYGTRPQILVAHKADDDYPAGKENYISSPTSSQLFGSDEVNQTDNHLTTASDRTHLAALGSRIKIKALKYYPLDPLKEIPSRDPQLEIAVKAPHTITVKIYAFADSGVVNGTAFGGRIWNDLQVARDVFAQVGVRIKLAAGFPKVVPLPSSMTDSAVRAHEFVANNADKETRKRIVGTPSVEGKKLIEACDRLPSEFSIVYCKQVLDNKGEPQYGGYAYPPSSCTAANLGNTAFVAGFDKNGSPGNDGMLMVLAHELGHLLTNEGHFGVNYPRRKDKDETLIPLDGWRIYNNLMRAGDGSRRPEIGASCRIDAQYQESKIIETVGKK